MLDSVLSTNAFVRDVKEYYPITAASYHNTYLYDDRNHPTAPTQIGNERYEYDANGNPILVTNDSLNTTRELYWDEENRLMVLSDNGKTSRYTYNHAGERIVKSHGDLEGVYINGAPQGITFHEHDDFTIYPASIISVNKNRYTKHYFIGSQRIASKLGSGRFNNVYGRNGSYITAGQQDYAERLNQIEQQRENYYRELGIAPGVPTMKGAYGDPENTGVGYNTIITELGDHSVPKNWEQFVVKRGPGETPGPPIIWSDPQNPEDAQPGYGFIADNSTEEETFFYHSDHLGSTNYITDDKGNITQYTAYLPYGELLVDEHSSSEDLPYKFNGKELDEETGLYYYGARYLNPVSSIWYGVDPLMEKYPNVSPYVYCLGNPVNAIDTDGRKVWIVIWATQSSDATGTTRIGHTGVVVENYKLHVNSNGIKQYESTGTYTYYDLWPSAANLGGKSAVQDVSAVYNSQDFYITTNGKKNTDYSALERYMSKHDMSQLPRILQDNIRENSIIGYGEGYAPDGIIKLDITGEQTYKLQQEYISLIRQGNPYNGESNNCTTFVANGINNSGIGSIKEERIIDWRGFFINFNPFHKSFTPNNTYNQLKKWNNSVVVKNAGNKTRESYEDAIIDR